MRILLISDLHIYNGSEYKKNGIASPSFADVTGRGLEGTAHSELLKFITDNIEMEFDAIICPGDITDRADQDGLDAGILLLENIASVMKDRISRSVPIFATIGNHDLDSRRTHNRYDGREYILSKHPIYPCKDMLSANQYWARAFTIDNTIPEMTILCINSAAYHIHAEQETNHGRITNLTLAAVKEELNNRDLGGINICLIHHHLGPRHIANQNDEEYTDRGSELIRLLNDRPEYWLIIHGHQHFGQVEYAAGGSRSPVILGLGSAFARPWAEIDRDTANQVYLLEFRDGTSRTGKILTFQYHKPGSWMPGSTIQNLPGKFGFGFRNLDALVNDIIESNFEATDGALVYNEFPELNFLIPTDMEQISTELQKKNVKLAVSRSEIVELIRI